MLNMDDVDTDYAENSMSEKNRVDDVRLMKAINASMDAVNTMR